MRAQVPFTPKILPSPLDSHTARRLARPNAAPQASGDVSGQRGDARLRMMCSHGGRFMPCGPHGGLRYVGGETRVLVVPREVSFRELAAKLGEVAGPGKIVAAVRYRLAVDGDDVLVSVTCDEELAHMRDEHDRLKATRPSATFRVFFTGVQRRPASGLPPLAPKIRRVQSEHALPARNSGVHPRAAGPAPMRRVQSAHQIAGSSRFQPCCYDRRNQCYCSCHLRRDLHPSALHQPMCPLPSVSKNAHGASPADQEEPPTMSKNAHGVRSPGQEPAPAVSPAKATDQVISEAAMNSSSEPEAEEVNRSAFWEFE